MRAFYIILRDTKNGNLLIFAFTHWGCTCAVFRVAGQYYHVPISIIPCNHLWCSVTSLSMNPKNDTFLSASTYVCQLRPFSTSQHNVTRLLTNLHGLLGTGLSACGTCEHGKHRSCRNTFVFLYRAYEGKNTLVVPQGGDAKRPNTRPHVCDLWPERRRFVVFLLNSKWRGQCSAFTMCRVVFAASFPDNTVRLFDARSPCNVRVEGCASNPKKVSWCQPFCYSKECMRT